MTRGHASLAPSKAYIWMTCPGQPHLVSSLSDKIVEVRSSYAEEGGAAHALAARCIQENTDPQDFIGLSISTDGLTFYPSEAVHDLKGWIPVTEDMVKAVRVYLDTVRAEVQDGDEVEVESLLQVNEHVWGTGDFVRYRPGTQELVVVDYKHGVGKFVSDEDNEQLLIYALGASRNLGNRGVSKIRVGVVQPRCYKGDPVRWVELTSVDVLDFWQALDVAIIATDKEKDILREGEHCRWCPAAPWCPALAKLQKVEKVPKTGEELSSALKNAAALTKWAKAVEEAAYALAINGGYIPGYKLVQPLGNRQWRDEKAAEKALSAHGVPLHEMFTLKSAPKMETYLGKKKFSEVCNDLVIRPQGKLSLVNNSNKNPAVHVNIRDDFKAITEGMPVA